MAQAKAPKARKTTTSAKKSVEVKEAEVITEAAPVEDAPETKMEVEPTKATAKAGKRSTKAVKEAEEKQAKQAAKQTEQISETEPKQVKKPARSKAERAGKKYRAAFKLVDKNKVYALDEALELATKTSTTKFDATVELHLNLGVDPKQADQNVRDTVTLPAGTGKTVAIAVFADDEGVKTAKAAGADIAGNEDFLVQLDKEQLNFDVLIAQPTMMAQLGKYARLLGPRGLMPNPKSGTVTTDIAKAVDEAKAGKVEFRVDQAGIIHLGVGKVSFGASKLKDNTDAVLSSIKSAKPASLKGTYIKSAYITTSMGPSIRVEV